MIKYLIFAFLLLHACSSNSVKSNQLKSSDIEDYIEAIEAKAKKILKIFPNEMQLSQVIEFKRNGDKKKAQVYISKNNDNILNITALGPFGVELASFVIKNESVRVSSLTPEQRKFFEKFIFTDVLLTYSKPKYLKEISDGELIAKDDGKVRYIYYKNSKIVEISYSSDEKWNSHVFIHNLIYDYYLNLENIDI